MSWSVLVVEDEFDGQQVLSELLSYLDVKSTLVSEAEDALDQLQQEAYDAVLIDLALPGMDGLELLRVIRQTPEINTIPCLVITAFTSSNVRRDVFAAGGDAFLAKPIDNTTFVQEIERLVKKQLS